MLLLAPSLVQSQVTLDMHSPMLPNFTSHMRMQASWSMLCCWVPPWDPGRSVGPWLVRLWLAG